MKVEITKPELIWPRKYDEQGNRVINRGAALPFQVSRKAGGPGSLGTVSDLFSARPSSDEEWRNKLIWGDNLLVMASLLEEYAGKVEDCAHAAILFADRYQPSEQKQLHLLLLEKLHTLRHERDVSSPCERKFGWN